MVTNYFCFIQPITWSLKVGTHETIPIGVKAYFQHTQLSHTHATLPISTANQSSHSVCKIPMQYNET